MIRVVVVEDSLVQRANLIRILEADGDIRVDKWACNAVDGVALVQRTHPDVVTMDLDLPGGGVRAIEAIMGTAPTPILVLSVHVGSRSAVVVEALAAGAVEALPKPARGDRAGEAQVRARVRTLRGLTVVRHPRGRLPRADGTPSDRPGMPVVALAASTGGPAALATVLSGLGGVDAPVLVVQHLHADFMDGLLQWLRARSALPVQSPVTGAPAHPATVYLAPARAHLRLDGKRTLRLSEEPRMLHRPSADELFRSVAERAGPAAVGVLLTGMGDDGAAGLLAMRARGAATIVQNEPTSAVFGMPRAAIACGAAEQVLPLTEIAAAIKKAVARVAR